jgi:acyl-CoA dehydrogenase
MSPTTETHVDFDEERTVFQTTADEFVRRDVLSVIDQARSEMCCPRGIFERAAGAGLLGALAPESSGGGGLSDPRFGELVIQAAVTAGATGTALAIGLHSSVAIPAVAAAYMGSDRTDLLAGMADGSTLVSLAGHAGEISAVACGAGLQLTGTARSVVNAANADKYLVVVNAADSGFRAALVDASAANVLPPANMLGARDAGARDVVFDGVSVDLGGVLVGEGHLVDEILMNCALVLSAVGIAGARAAVAHTVAYAQDRKVFGRPVAEFENTQFVLVGLWAELLVAASYHDDCARRRGLGALRMAEAGAALERSRAVHEKAVDQGMQLHGGYGYMLEYPIAQAFADARFVSLLAEAMQRLRPALLTDLGL